MALKIFLSDVRNHHVNFHEDPSMFSYNIVYLRRLRWLANLYGNSNFEFAPISMKVGIYPFFYRWLRIWTQISEIMWHLICFRTKSSEILDFWKKSQFCSKRWWMPNIYGILCSDSYSATQKTKIDTSWKFESAYKLANQRVNVPRVNVLGSPWKFICRFPTPDSKSLVAATGEIIHTGLSRRV